VKSKLKVDNFKEYSELFYYEQYICISGLPLAEIDWNSWQGVMCTSRLEYSHAL
jgi:hypothetical protein